MGRRRKAAVALVAALIWPSGARTAPAVEACCPPEVRAYTAWQVERPNREGDTWIGADDRDGVYAIWDDSVLGASIAISRDGGTTWAAPYPQPIAGPDVHLAGAANTPDGWLALAYEDAGRIKVDVSRDQGVRFAPSRVLTTTSRDEPGRPVIAYGPTGMLAVAWEMRTSRVNGATGIFGAVSPDGGGTWSAAQRLDDPLVEDPWLNVRIRVAVSESRAVVFWNKTAFGGSGPFGLWSASSSDGGASWSPQARVDSLDGTARPSSLDVGVTGPLDFQAAYSFRLLTGEIELRVAVTTDGGVGWPGLETVLGSGPVSSDADLLALPGGAVYAAWADSRAQTAFSASDADGLPGTWFAAPTDFSPAGSKQHNYRIAAQPGGAVSVVHDDYRDNTVPGETRESLYAARSCDGGVTWAETETRIDPDEPGVDPHSEDPEVATDAGGRIHVLWVSGTVNQHVEYARLDPAAPVDVPEISVTELPPNPCGGPYFLLEVDPASLGDCGAPSFQWLVDGDPIPGVSGPSYEVPDGTPPGPHLYRVLVTCAPARACGNLSREVEVVVPQVSSRVVGREIDGFLRVGKELPSLRLRWDDQDPAAMGYSLYEGEIGTYYSHEALACHLPRTPPGAVSQSQVIPMPAGSRYYLVTPNDCLGEGDAGRRSNGALRPVAAAGSPCGPIP